MSCSKACIKSARVTFNFSTAFGSTSTLFDAFIRRFIAVDCAALTKPSNSAPEKFFVKAANSYKHNYTLILRYIRIIYCKE